MCFPSSNGIKDIFNEEQDNTVTIYHLQEMHIRRKMENKSVWLLQICTKS